MSDVGAFFVAAGIAFAGWYIAHGLDSIGDAIRKLAK